MKYTSVLEQPSVTVISCKFCGGHRMCRSVKEGLLKSTSKVMHVLSERQALFTLRNTIELRGELI